MTRRGLPISRVSVDRVSDGGDAVHELTAREELNLGVLPPESVGEELLVETWDRNEARVVDPRYQPEIDPPLDNIPPSEIQARLSMNNPDLKKGHYVVGIARKAESGGEVRLITGGYQIDIPDLRPGELVIARIEEARNQKFGANHAEATRIDQSSAFLASTEADLGLKRLMSDGSWRKVPLGEVERIVLPEVVRQVEESQPVSILNTGFDSEFPLRVAIELLYNADPQSNVALLTSGTSVQWGQKGEVRDAYRGYGLAVNEGLSDTAVPLDQVFAHSYVHDGQMKTSSESLLARRLVLTKKADELSAVADLSVIVVDYTSRKAGTDEETIIKLREQFPNTPIVTVASPYTKNEEGGVPRYAPPRFLERDDCIPNANDIEVASGHYTPQVGRTSLGTNGEHYASGPVSCPLPPSTTDMLGLLREQRIQVQSVEGGELTRWFKMATDHFGDLLDNGVEQAAYKIYSVEMFFERLPVSPYSYNEWIRQQYAEGKRYLPETTDGILEDLQTYGGQIEDLKAPASVFGAAKALSEIEDGLRERNPMFHRIRDEVSKAVDGGYRLGIFCPRKSWVHMLRECLYQEGVPEDAVGTNVVLLDSDSIRDMPPCRRLLFTGPQRPQYAGFYLHPRTKETVILSYDGRWTDIIKKHAKQYVSRLNMATSGTTDEPYPMPVIDAGSSSSVDTETDPQFGDGEPIEGDLPTKGESGTAENSQNVDLADEDMRRLIELVELAPTKNSELAEAWGYDSGSEVYHYLNSNLREFYTRNEDKLIVPTEEGEQAVEGFDKKH